MSDETLHALVEELAEAMDERAWKEFSDYLEIQHSVAIGSSGYANYDVGLEDYESSVDPYRLFQPFLDLPLPGDFDGEIAQLRNVRQNVGDAYVQIGGLRSDSSTWVSDTGDYFNVDYVPMLEMAAAAHVALLEELERLLVTYRNLLAEAWDAAKQLASGIIDKLKRPDAAVDFDFRTLLNLGLAAAGALLLTVEPPIGFALIVGGTTAALGILDAGKAVVQDIAVHGSTAREIMDSARTAVENLKEGLHEKGATLSGPLNRVQALISRNSARVAPAPPNLEPA